MNERLLKLPAIADKVIIRPGSYKSGTVINVPAPAEFNFWEMFYSKLANSGMISFPVKYGQEKINPFFGYFGYRWHPINFTPKYFHIGIDIMEDVGYSIKNITSGQLEYSGFINVNGLYLMLIHPEITTEDGFVLHSIYMHLKKSYWRFNLVQKICRELPLRDLIKVQVEQDAEIGTIGDTGNPLGNVPHLHFQMEFRNKVTKQKIAIDPAKAFGLASLKNLTADISTPEEFKIFYHNNKISLNPWLKFWSNKL